MNRFAYNLCLTFGGLAMLAEAFLDRSLFVVAIGLAMVLLALRDLTDKWRNWRHPEVGRRAYASAKTAVLDIPVQVLLAVGLLGMGLANAYQGNVVVGAVVGGSGVTIIAILCGVLGPIRPVNPEGGGDSVG